MKMEYKKLKIGIDVDEVLASLMTRLNSFYNEIHGTNFHIEDYHSYNLEDTWGGDNESAVGIVNKFYNSPYFDGIRPLNKSQEVIEQLSRKNQLMVITSRPDFIKEKTEEWVKKYFPRQFEKIICTGRYVSSFRHVKSDICLAENIGLIIEDSLEICLDCVDNGINAILFDKPWNRNGSGKDSGVIRVKNWNEVLEVLNHE